MQAHKTVSRDEWLEARRALLAKEKAHLRAHDELARQRRELPWVKVDKSYVFDGPDGKETLADLFAGRSQLIVKHFMFGPDWQEGCVGCSFGADQMEGSLVHLVNHDVMVVAVSRAPYPKIAAFHKRMGWPFKWVSSAGSRLQLRLQRVVHRGAEGHGQGLLQFRGTGLGERRAAGLQRLHQG